MGWRRLWRSGFRRVYGIDPTSLFQPLKVADLGVQALDDGVAEVAVAFSTDPQLSRPDVLTLRDDLKMISGVGPKIEATLNEIGIFTFAQVAGWKKAEREWVDGYLNFRGRIERDDWVKQAKALAKGGEAEYIKVFGKKPR